MSVGRVTTVMGGMEASAKTMPIAEAARNVVAQIGAMDVATNVHSGLKFL